MRSLLLFAFVAMVLAGCASDFNVKPKAGYVPDRKTAEQIAEAAWKPVYGAEEIDGQKPFETELRGRKWFVFGTLTPSTPGAIVVGGTAEIEIDKYTGKILRMSHGE